VDGICSASVTTLTVYLLTEMKGKDLNLPRLPEERPTQIIILRPKVIHYQLNHITRQYTFVLLHLMGGDDGPLA
jgi:hypothetical protein